MESRARAVEALLARSSGGSALGHAIQAAELYMAAAAEASNKALAARLRRRCHELIDYAEKLKSQQVPSCSSVAQSDVLVRASRLHGNDFPPWTADPRDDEFELQPGAELFTDDAAFSLSTTQVDNFAAWTRPAQLFALDAGRDRTQDESVMMQLTQSCDLVQDITTDCSVVASLSAAAKILVGRHAVLSSIIYPFDHARGRPKLSASGKYVLRMNFNGCARRVVVDDRLPASRTDRTLFVVDRQNPCLLWPALLEKAYLKVRGGYDFPGSNSGTDLWVLTGWIPEQLFLQRGIGLTVEESEDLDLSETWTRIKEAYDALDVVVTLGTGRISAEEERLMGLIGEHDYAVEDLVSDSGTRRLLIKNPWRDAPLAMGTDPLVLQGSPVNNTTWMALEDVAQHFESMYLNWNPSLFSHRQDHHFAWETPPTRLCASLVRNPQYTFNSIAKGSIWILVNRHFVDAELGVARRRRCPTASAAHELGFMSILVFDNQDKRVQVGGAESYRGPYVDSLQTLARLEVIPGQRSTIVLDQQELLLPSYTFTISFFSQAPLEIKQAEEAMSHFQERSGSWGRRTAGGSSSCPTYFQNPQYRLSIDTSATLSILLSTDNRDVHVHVDLVWARGERVTTLRARDVVASSGEYRRGCAVADVLALGPGQYTLVCSTFEAGQMAAYSVRVSSMVPVTLEALPVSTAGMLRTPLATLNVAHGERARRAPLLASWLTRASVSLHGTLMPGAEDGGQQPSSLLIRVSVVHGGGPEQVTIAASGGGQFQEPAADLRTASFDMEPERIHREGLWLVVECIGSQHVAWAIDGEILSDSPVHVGAWEP